MAIRFNSLKARYAVVAASLGMSVLVGAFFVEHQVNIARDTSSQNLETRLGLIQHSRHIRDAVWQAREALEVFLLDPQAKTHIHSAINDSLNYTNQLLHVAWVQENEHEAIVNRLREALLRLDDSAKRLIVTRTNPSLQYPSIAIAREGMYETQGSFNGELDILIQDLQDNLANPRTLKMYQDCTNLGRNWLQLTAVFRMYLINRISSFSQETLAQQELNVEIYYSQVVDTIKRLQKQNQGRRDPFMEQSLNQMQKSAFAWHTQFEKVKQIHRSNNWRTDLQLFKHEIEKEFEDIWDNLRTIDLMIEDHYTRDIQYLNRISSDQTHIFWFFTGLSMVTIIIGYLLLERIVIRPIADISQALRNEAMNNSSTALPTYDILEVKNLTTAFGEMRHQVHSRQEALEYQTLHDPLTGLANRSLLNDHLLMGIESAKRNGNSLALFILDLDRFKEINDTLGHQMGDELLQQVGQRIAKNLRQIDTVARMGGDEFAILLAEGDEETSRKVAKKILKSLDQHFSVNNIQLHVGASMGIAVFPQHGLDPLSLVKSADVAMYTAKRSKAGYSFYEAHLDNHSLGRLALSSDLRNALDLGQLHLVFQPIMDMRSNRVTKAEVLLRWTHPQHGPIAPMEIISLAEHIGLINPLTYWILDRAMWQAQQWRSRGIDIIPSVNLSAYSLQDDDLLPRLDNLLIKHQLQRGQLTLEITENAMIVDPEAAVKVLNQIGKMGIYLSIDDFGTGYSSLAYLKRLPIHELKIDKSFVMHIHKNDNDAVIVKSTIDLAHNLGLRIVAEGVEDQDTLDLLRIIQCDAIQGYFLHRPVDATGLEDWFRQSDNGYNIVPLHKPA